MTNNAARNILFGAAALIIPTVMLAQTGPVIQNVTLINSDTNQPIAGYNPIPAGATLNLATLRTRNLNIRANTQPSVVGSVRFVFGSTNRTENFPPYAMTGDPLANYNDWTPGLGQFTLRMTGYTGSQGTGTAGPTLTVSFNVVDSPTDAIGDVPATGTATVSPTEINDILYNPGMGFADFHLGWGRTLPISEYPPTRVAYFRWTWSELEPASGQFNFTMVDNAIARAKAKNERLAIRIMPGLMPAWLSEQGVGQLGSGSSVIPDHNNPLFLSYHERLVQAFGLRYAGSSDIDHVDIGSVGCWGEWNSACCPAGRGNTCSAYMPNQNNRRAIVDWYYRYFRNTPLVALVEGAGYPNTLGAGWRGDCFGDYGMFSSNWSHMANFYPSVAAKPEVINAWEKAPVQFEACGVMQDWYNRGFNIDLILQRGLDWHVSVFNAKNSPVPAAWRPKIDAWLKKIGYRFVLTRFTHPYNVARGAQMQIEASWINRGVAPAYRPWPLAYRLRSGTGVVVAQWRSSADVRRWLPGTHQVQDSIQMPSSVAAGVYALDMAILDEKGTDAFVQLAIGGKRNDLWYPVSRLRVK